jgi:mannan endo-1,4-beta-mannosidase
MKKMLFILIVLCVCFQGFSQTYPGFRVQGRFLYDNAGEQVILVGVNKMIIWTDIDGVPTYEEIAKTGANCVRIVWGISGTAEQLDLAIYNCRINNMIPIPELHDATGEWSELQSCVDYWCRSDIVDVLKRHEEYLIVNIANECGQDVSDADYRSGYQSAVSQMRNAGIHAPLMIDAPGYGQDIDSLQANGPYLISRDPDQNLLFSVHMWWPYCWGNTDQKVIDEIAESVSLNLPLVVGEFGNKWDETGNCDIPYLLIIDQCTANQIGWLPWSWGPGNDPQSWLDMTTDSTYNTLFGWGREVAVTHTNSIKNTAKRPASITGTTPVPSPSPVPTPEGNIAMGKPVTVSSTESSEFTGENAVDGNSSTRWASVSQSDPQWIYIDLGASTQLTRVILYWEAAYATQYRIQVSDDANNWTDLLTEYNGDGGTDDLSITGSGRYVRMYGMQHNNWEWGYSLWEFAVYGTSGETPTPAPGTPGDVNGSGTVDIIDALLIAQYYVGLNPANFNSQVADVNCSGGIDIVDALLVAQYYVGLISSFPC